ncbi:ferrochelatase [Chrysiogenes arsenatis]|uniref:ferrochelatase n=1 Tax=Chrysiogenes arsenatis TaxID=309797 RepID=UPI00042439E5|nr:ferrochelatase [Chrysiogenes arsenatis]
MKLGVLLLNMGGPDSIESVLPFLQNLFNDPRILGIKNGVLRRTLASYIISKRIAGSIANYEKIGGKSPILEHTQALAVTLEEILRANGCDALVRPAMRYTPPRTPEVVAELVAAGCEHIVAVSLYPQESMTTTGSSIDDDFMSAMVAYPEVSTSTVRHYPDYPGYIAALQQRIDEAVAPLPEKPFFLFSAHSLPRKIIDRGDPYLAHIHRTVSAVMALYPNTSHELVFQSKATRGKWLEPDIAKVLPQLIAGGMKHILVIPISFVSDHIETLYELDMEYREIAEQHDVATYTVMPGLNGSELFAQALAEMIQKELLHDRE